MTRFIVLALLACSINYPDACERVKNVSVSESGTVTLECRDADGEPLLYLGRLSGTPYVISVRKKEYGKQRPFVDALTIECVKEVP